MPSAHDAKRTQLAGHASCVMPVVNHVGITVSDLDRSLTFYRDVVGFAVHRRTEASGATWFATLTENPGAEVRSVTMRLGDFSLQLVEYIAGGAPGAAPGHATVGNVHFCVNVDSLDERHEQL